MLIYASTKSDFMIDTENDRLETKLYENIKLKMNRTTGLSELNAWRNSLKEMYITLNDSDIPKDAGVAIEYNIPQTSKRVDFLISGYGLNGKGNVVIVELKQWEKLTAISDEQKSMFGGKQNGQEALGKCPKCGGDVVKGKYGAYCKNKCGMNVGKAMGTVLSDTQIKSMLEGKKTFVKGLKGKKGSYDAYLIPEGIEDYSYTKDGKEIKGSQYKVKLEFLKK